MDKMTKFNLQYFIFPANCKIAKHIFSPYDPNLEYSEQDSLDLLSEDLLQVIFEEQNIVVDLGWYGGSSNKNGIFKIYVIQGTNWDKPIKVESSSNQSEIAKKFQEILNDFSGQITKYG